MKRIAIAFLLAMAFGVASAQSSHSVTLNWTASPDSTTTMPGTANIYRATQACPVSGTSGATFTQIATKQPAGGPYVDTNVTAGQTYCYYVAAVITGAEAPPSNTGAGTVPTASCTLLTVTAK